MRTALLDRAVATLCWLRRHRRVRPGQAPVLVNVGSALDVAPGWFHVDAGLPMALAGWPTPVLRAVYRLTSIRNHYSIDRYLTALTTCRFIHHDAGRYGIPFPDDSVDVVYSSHFLEHLYHAQAQAFLRDTHRVLRPGGIVRICVPDLSWVFASWSGGRKDAAMEVLYQDEAVGVLGRHKYLWDADMLGRDLSSAGFRSVFRRAWREGDAPDLALLDNRPELTLYMEARKD